MKTAFTIIGSVIVGVAAMSLFAKVQNETTSETFVTVDSIKKVAKLATVEYNVSVVEKRTVPLNVKVGITLKLKKAKFLVLTSGIVTGSVDLNKAKIDIDKETKKVKIVFNKNAVNVSNAAINKGYPEFITITDRKLFKRLKDEDFAAGARAANAKLKSTAESDGIVKKTKAEAKTLITNFLASLGYSTSVKFR